MVAIAHFVLFCFYLFTSSRTRLSLWRRGRSPGRARAAARATAGPAHLPHTAHLHRARTHTPAPRRSLRLHPSRPRGLQPYRLRYTIQLQHATGEPSELPPEAKCVPGIGPGSIAGAAAAAAPAAPGRLLRLGLSGRHPNVEIRFGRVYDSPRSYCARLLVRPAESFFVRFARRECS